MSKRALGRRPQKERKIIALLRGDVALYEHLPDKGQMFGHLAEVAKGAGLSLMPLDCRYAGEDELKLLVWIASAQRQVGGAALPDNPHLTEAIRACADMLVSVDLRLSALSLYGDWGHDAPSGGGSVVACDRGRSASQAGGFA